MNDKDPSVQLINKAKVSRGTYLMDVVKRHQKIFFRRMNSKGVPYECYLDLRAMSPENVDFLMRWLGVTYQERINRNEPIILSYEVLKACPVWRKTIMPYKVMRKR